MAYPGRRFEGTGAPIEVGGLKTSDAKKIAADTATVFDANNERIVEIHNTEAGDCFFNIKIGGSNITAESANGNGFISGKNTTRPFVLPANAYIKANKAIIVTSLDLETLSA